MGLFWIILRAVLINGVFRLVRWMRRVVRGR